MSVVLAIAVPTVGALLVALLSSVRSARVCGVVATATSALAFAAALVALRGFAGGGASPVAEIGQWLPLRGADLAFRLEAPLAPVLLAITGAATLSFAASLAAPLPARTYVAALVVVSAAAALCAASGLLLVFAAWEIGAVATYVLLAARADRAGAADTARAFLAGTRVTDSAALVGVFGILAVFHSVDLAELRERVAIEELIPGALESVRWSSALLALAALARCGQLPFSRWLVAMDVPALSRSIVLAVAAPCGAVLLLRLAEFAARDTLVATGAVAAASAIVAAAVGFAQAEDRRALAWGTVARLGVVIAALPLSPVAAAGLLFLHIVSQTALTLGQASAADRPARAVTVLASVADLAFVVTAPLAARRVLRAVRPSAAGHPGARPAALHAAVVELGLAQVGRGADAALAAATRPLALGTERIIADSLAVVPAFTRAGRAVEMLSLLPPRAAAALFLATIAAIVLFWVAT